MSLDPAVFRDLVRRALAEDVGARDITTEAIVPARARARGALIVKAPGVLAGLDVAVETFRQLDPDVSVTDRLADGRWCEPGERVAELAGAARALLTGERTALNFLQRLSGIATLTRRFVQMAAGRIIVLDTRKTTPTLRALEKYAVRVGGGTNHRMGLDDAILVKDNHISVAGGMSAALARVTAAGRDRAIAVEVEVTTLDEVDEALRGGADILLLDNMRARDMREAIGRCRGRAKTEISGGVSLANLPEIATLGADFVSIGALTHSAPALDVSFEIEPE